MAVLLRLLVFALRLLGLLFFVRVLSGSGGRREKPRVERPQGRGAKGLTSELVRDKVCNTFLPKDRALLAQVSGREEAFCSAACRDRALAEASKAS